MNQQRGPSYVLSLISLPYLAIARSGLLGVQAQQEAEVALQDLANSGPGVVGIVLLAFVAIALLLLLFR